MIYAIAPPNIDQSDDQYYSIFKPGKAYLVIVDESRADQTVKVITETGLERWVSVEGDIGSEFAFRLSPGPGLEFIQRLEDFNASSNAGHGKIRE